MAPSRPVEGERACCGAALTGSPRGGGVEPAQKNAAPSVPAPMELAAGGHPTGRPQLQESPSINTPRLRPGACGPAREPLPPAGRTMQGQGSESNRALTARRAALQDPQASSAPGPQTDQGPLPEAPDGREWCQCHRADSDVPLCLRAEPASLSQGTIQSARKLWPRQDSRPAPPQAGGGPRRAAQTPPSPAARLGQASRVHSARVTTTSTDAALASVSLLRGLQQALGAPHGSASGRLVPSARGARQRAADTGTAAP